MNRTKLKRSTGRFGYIKFRKHNRSPFFASIDPANHDSGPTVAVVTVNGAIALTLACNEPAAFDAELDRIAEYYNQPLNIV